MAKKVSAHGKQAGIFLDKSEMMKVNRRLKAKMKDIAGLLVGQLSYIGDECVRTARESGSYNDITGNLRSSVGYVVLYDGKPVVYGAPKQYDGKKGHGEAGPPAAEALLTSLQAEYPRGIVLIVCAGMKYAVYVEAVHHKDVLTSAKLKAESLARKLLKVLVE